MNQQLTKNDDVPNHCRLDACTLIGLLLVSVLALTLRLHRLDAESLWMDEAAQVSIYKLPVKYLVLNACRQGQPPLDYLIGAGLERLHLAGSDWWVRFPAAMFGTGCVFLFGILISRITGSAAGIAAALLLAFCPLHVAMSQEVRPYTIFFFFALAVPLTFMRARQRQTLWSWCLFGLVLLAMLMTRGLAPHVLSLGLVAFAMGCRIACRRPMGPEACDREKRRLWATFSAVAVAYAIYNPIFGVIYVSTKSYLFAATAPWPLRVGAMLHGAYQAILGGGHADPAMTLARRWWFQVAVASFAASGLVLMLRSGRRKRNSRAMLFLDTLTMFPLLYAMLYVRSTGFSPKPQYLLLLAAPLLGGIAVATDALRRELKPTGRILPWLAFAIIIGGVGIPMGLASVRALYRQDKADWRGALNYLRDHAEAGDAVASVRPHWSANSMGAFVVGAERYFKRGAKILRIEYQTSLDRLTKPPWSQRDKTVWIICNKVPTLTEILPTPLRPTRTIRIHDFHRLFLLEIRGEGLAEDRLVEGLAFLDRDLSDHGGLVAPNLLRARYHFARGESQQCEACIAAARRSCRNDAERSELAGFLPNVNDLRFTYSGPVE